MKAIVKCYWKSCLVLGIFTFLEVKFFYILCVAFKCVQISTEMDETCGREVTGYNVSENLSVM